MKLNNKGFAVSTFMYMILVLAIILILATLAILSSRKMILDRQKTTALDNIKTAQKEAGIAKSYIGYYADVDRDGTVDGIIYADLAHSQSGDFYNAGVNWGQGDGTYSYTAQTGLKEYTISDNKYTGEKAKFGEKEIITLKPNSSGNKRFYVMALEDFRTGSFEAGNGACNNGNDCTLGTYYWYKNAFGNLDALDTNIDFKEGYNNTGKIIEIWNAGIDGKYNAAGDNHDIFKYIQEKYQEGWYIPSRGEWAAFADYLSNRKENSLTNDYVTGSFVENSGNYNDIYGLKEWYWSSSESDTYNAWYVHFPDGYMRNYYVYDNIYIRLGMTF